MDNESSFIPVKSYKLENELETILRSIDEPIPIVVNGAVNIKEIKRERVVQLVDFCRGLLCGLKMGR